MHVLPFILHLSLSVWGAEASAPSGPAQATVEAQARQLFEAGNVAYGRARYKASIRAFEETLQLLPKSGVIFSLAQAYRRQYFVDHDPHKLRRALKLYQRYVEDVPEARRRADAVEQIQALSLLRTELKPARPRKMETPKPTVPITEVFIYSELATVKASVDGGALAELPRVMAIEPGMHSVEATAPGYLPYKGSITAIEGRLIPVPIQLEAKPARLKLRAPDSATVQMNQSVVRRAEGPIELVPGTHEIKITERGHYPFVRSITVERDQELELDVQLKTTTQRYVAYYSFGAAATLAVGGLTTTLLAVHFEGQAQDIEDKRGTENISREERASLNRHVSRRDAFRTASIALWSTAVVAGGVGAFLYFWEPSRPPRTKASETGRRALGFTPSASGGLVTWSGAL